MRYCSTKCQKQGYGLHKSYYKRIAGFASKLNVLEIQSCSYIDTDEPIGPNNIFETDMGYFDRYQVTKQYVKVRITTAKSILEMAYISIDTVERGAAMYELALRHFHEVLRFSPFFPGALEGVALLLAALGHDDACFSILSYFLRDRVEPVVCIEAMNTLTHAFLAKSTVPERWVFPAFSARHTIDLADVNDRHTFNFICMLLVKIRMLTTCQNGFTGMDVFHETTSGVELQELHGVVLSFLVGEPPFRASLEEEIGSIFDAMCAHNMVMLLALLHGSEPLPREQPTFAYELWLIVKDTFGCTDGIHG